MNTIPTRLLFIFLINLFPFPGFAQKEIYELRIYKMKTAEQIKATDNYLENAYLPALHRIGIKQIGVFKPISNDTAALKEIIVIVPYISLDVWHRTRFGVGYGPGVRTMRKRSQIRTLTVILI